MFRTKIVKSGSVVEVYTFNLPDHKRFHDKASKYWDNFGSTADLTADESLGLSYTHSRKTAKRIIYSNAWRWFSPTKRVYQPFFLTLTFAENITDLKEANRLFSKFIQRLNYLLTGKKKSYLAYLSVPEFQKRGAIHYHVIIFNLPYMPHRVYHTLIQLWGKGRIQLVKVDCMDRLINYLSKYMVKSSDPRLNGKKRYFASRVCLRPQISYDFMTTLRLPDSMKIYSAEWETDYLGHMTYRMYILDSKAEHDLYFDTVCEKT